MKIKGKKTKKYVSDIVLAMFSDIKNYLIIDTNMQANCFYEIIRCNISWRY